MQTFTLKEIADRNGVSKSVVKGYAGRNGYKPVDTTGTAYRYPADLMAVIAEKYGEPANSKKLFDEAVANTESKQDDTVAKRVDGLTERVDQLIDFASWWAQLDDQRTVPVYFYRFILDDKSIRNDKRTIKIVAYFGNFSLNPKNARLRDAVANGAFKSLVRWVYTMLWKPADIYQSIQRWNKFSSSGKQHFVKYLDDRLSKNYKSYRDFKSGGSGGGKPHAKKADSAPGSSEPVATRCKSALLASQEDEEKEV